MLILMSEKQGFVSEKNLSLIAMVALLALTIQTVLSPDFLLTVIEYGKKPGLMS